MKIAACFEVLFHQILNEEGQLVETLPEWAKDSTSLLFLYRSMVLNRLFDNKAIALQRTGKMGTYPSMRGQEAIFTGIGHAMAPQDTLVPYYRDVAALVQRGVRFTDIMLYWGGDERGNVFAQSADFPFCVPIATQNLHAVGVATAIKIKKEARAVLTTCGDGATSEGDFYEALNLAGVWQLPIVFVISNNQWAISVPRSAQTAAITLAQKAIAAGIEGEQVDGNDVIAVRERIGVALDKARRMQIPTVIEALCYRHSDHTTADDASRYEHKGLREDQWKYEPINRLRLYLERLNQWSEEDETALIQSCTEEIEQAVQEYFAMTPMPPEDLIDYLYATLPKTYLAQRELLFKIGQNYG